MSGGTLHSTNRRRPTSSGLAVILRSPDFWDDEESPQFLLPSVPKSFAQLRMTSPGARARSSAPLTPCGALGPAFSFERWGLNQVGGLAGAASHRRKRPTCFKPLFKSLSRIALLNLPLKRCGRSLTPPPSSWQSNILPNPNPKCKRNFWSRGPVRCKRNPVRLSLS